MTSPKPQFEFYSLLVRHEVPFVIIGGHAVQFHGYLRNTEDVDILWVRSEESEPRLLAALREANAQWISNEKDPQAGLERVVPVSQAYLSSTHLMMLLTDYGFVDIFDYVPGFPEVDPRELYAQSVPSGQLRYVSLEWLKKMKKAADRPKDRLDLENL
jgi:hypothetical protein